MGRLAPGSPEPYEFLGTQPMSALLTQRVASAERAEWFATLRYIVQLPTYKWSA